MNGQLWEGTVPFVVTQSGRDGRLPWLWREPAPQRCQ